MANGFVNNDFSAEGSGAFANELTAYAFDGACSVGIPGGWVSNLGLRYAGSAVTIYGGDNNNLSTSNPGYVIIPSKANPRFLKKYTITANQGFLDSTSGSSEIINNTFGLTTGVAYTDDIPFFIYAVGNDDEDAIAFMISRVPNKKNSPVLAEIGDPSSAVADHQYSFFSFDDIDESKYDENPCVCIGSFRMKMNGSDDWAFVNTATYRDGIGKYQEDTLFDQPAGTFGNTAGKHFYDNAGTAPVFTTNYVRYTISREGICHVYFALFGDGGTDGAGAVTSIFFLPFQCLSLGDNVNAGTGIVSATGGTNGLASYQFTNGGNQVTPVNINGGVWQHVDFGNGARAFRGTIHYNVRTS